MPSLPARPAMRMRARASPERSHLRPGQPVPGSCPASPSAAAGLAVPPAITLQSLRRRHRRQFCSPQPWQLRARASSIRRRRHLTPRAGQRHQPLTARPNLPSPRLQCLQSSRTSLLQRMQRQHHVRGRADWRTCMPSHAPHSPPAWSLDRSADSSTSFHRTACRVMLREGVEDVECRAL